MVPEKINWGEEGKRKDHFLCFPSKLEKAGFRAWDCW